MSLELSVRVTRHVMSAVRLVGCRSSALIWYVLDKPLAIRLLDDVAFELLTCGIDKNADAIANADVVDVAFGNGEVHLYVLCVDECEHRLCG